MPRPSSHGVGDVWGEVRRVGERVPYQAWEPPPPFPLPGSASFRQPSASPGNL